MRVTCLGGAPLVVSVEAHDEYVCKPVGVADEVGCAAGQVRRSMAMTPDDEGEPPRVRTAMGVLYGLAMVAVIVAVDLLFFRDHPWPRLAANFGIVLLFGAFYVRFLGT